MMFMKFCGRPFGRILKIRMKGLSKKLFEITKMMGLYMNTKNFFNIFEKFSFGTLIIGKTKQHRTYCRFLAVHAKFSMQNLLLTDFLTQQHKLVKDGVNSGKNVASQSAVELRT